MTYVIPDETHANDMKPNPGGQLAIENIVGRDDLIADMWGILEGRSIYMNDLRRVGKTMILRKMEANQPSGWLAVKRDLGGCHTAAEFATQAYRDSNDVLSPQAARSAPDERVARRTEGRRDRRRPEAPERHPGSVEGSAHPDLFGSR